MVAINNPNYLKYMMSFDANGAGTGTVQRATSIQPVASNIELRRPPRCCRIHQLHHSAGRSPESAPIAADATAISGVAVRQLIRQPAHA
jgi:hypothetical protein